MDKIIVSRAELIMLQCQLDALLQDSRGRALVSLADMSVKLDTWMTDPNRKVENY